MYHSVVKVKNNCGPEFFKIKLQSLIYILHAKHAHAVLLCCLLVIISVYTSDMLNKNTLGIKKVRGQSEAALQTGMPV